MIWKFGDLEMPLDLSFRRRRNLLQKQDASYLGMTIARVCHADEGGISFMF
jgi:hypothetical protein